MDMKRTVLMLEHDDDDRYITKVVVDESQYNVDFRFVSSADEFFKHLDHDKTGNLPLPSLILLSYDAHTIDILGRIRATPSSMLIPVVVISGTINDDIVKESYQAGANSVIQKPSEWNLVEDTIKSFIYYWFKVVSLP
jgi:CheY-like chemotaxis protein